MKDQAFTRQEIDLLFDALTAWENKDTSIDLMDTIMSGCLPPTSGEQDKRAAELQVRRDKRDEESRVRKERSVLIKAKLIGMKDSLVADAELALAVSGAEAPRGQG